MKILDIYLLKFLRSLKSTRNLPIKRMSRIVTFQRLFQMRKFILLVVSLIFAVGNPNIFAKTDLKEWLIDSDKIDTAFLGN